MDEVVRVNDSGGGGSGAPRTYLRDPEGTSTGGQFTKNPNAASSSAKSGSKSKGLRRGARGEDVRKLQQALTAAGFKTTVDGIFGPKTEASVRAAQKKLGLPVTGVATPDLMRRLAAQTSGTAPGPTQTMGTSRTLRSGTEGADVRDLQRLMSALGIETDDDGKFGPKTAESVKEIQKRLGLKPTGTASKALVNKMLNAYDLSPCIKRSAQYDAAYEVLRADYGDEEEHVLLNGLCQTCGQE
jgi:peptidoglycan hydrolase-like protein with peptidoglycan-binding domain